jgi:hypothetical protein
LRLFVRVAVFATVDVFGRVDDAFLDPTVECSSADAEALGALFPGLAPLAALLLRLRCLCINVRHCPASSSLVATVIIRAGLENSEAEKSATRRFRN